MSKSFKTPASALNSLMKEYQLNPFCLSRQIGLSASAVRQIVIGESGITIPTALRLAKFFGQCPSYWLDLQLQVDMQEAAADKKLQSALKSISKVKKPSAPAKAITKDKMAKRSSISEKRKQAAKAPGAKQAARKRVK